MNDDTGFGEVRSVRHQISVALAHDPAMVVDHYREFQLRFRDRLRPGPEQEADTRARHWR